MSDQTFNEEAVKGESVYMVEVNTCDICHYHEGALAVAYYDTKTRGGPWANVCQRHMDETGSGIGVGKGQRFIYSVQVQKEISKHYTV